MLKKKSKKKPKMNKILILHGWEGNPTLYWFPKAKKMFENEGYKVFTPELPGGYYPKKEEWLNIIRDYSPDENWILIGHSLGGVAILKYLEETMKPVKKVILIATPFEPMSFSPIANFFTGGFNWEKIQKNSAEIIIMNETNDTVVPLEHGKKYSKELGVDLDIIPGGTHFHIIDLNHLKKMVN